MRKKLVSFLLIFGMMTSIIILPSEAAAFSDISGHWAQTSIEYCSGKGYVSGFDDGTFRPDEVITRGQLAVILDNVKGLWLPTWNTFSDVNSSNYYYWSVLKCVKAGYMTGYSSSAFGPSDPLTREQAAVIIANAYGYTANSGRTGFADDNEISNWAVNSVKACVSAGVISGMGNNRFCPWAYVTRAQLVTMIYAAEGGKVESTKRSAYQKMGAHNGTVNMLVVGDSISVAQGASGMDAGFAAVLERNLESQYNVNINVTNIGFGGAASYGCYVRTMQQDSSADYDLIIVCVGYNDEEKNFSLYYEALIRALKTKYSDSNIVAVLEHAERSYTNKINSIINICSHYSIPTADVITAYNNSGKNYSELVCSDGLHPNNDGYEVYADTIKQVIEDQVNAGTGFGASMASKMNSGVSKYEHMVYISRDRFYNAADNILVYDTDGTISGYIGMDYEYWSGTSTVEVYFDDSLVKRFQYTLNQTTSQEKYVPFEVTGTARKSIKIVFPAKDQANNFRGLIINY